MIDESFVIVDHSSDIQPTSANEIEVINRTPGKENVPLTKSSVGL